MEIGNNKENLVLKTAGKLKVQWGNKFVDLLDKNGNLNVKHLKILQSVESEEDLKKDGLYIINDDFIVFYNGKILLTLSNNKEETSNLNNEEINNLIELLLDLIKTLSDKVEELENHINLSE